MERGTQFHDKVIYAKSSDKEAKNIRKEISPISPQTEQYHDLYLESPSLHLGARLDFFEKQGDLVYPVEIKTGIKPRDGHAQHNYVQLTAQALLLEEKFNVLVDRARIVYLSSNDTEWVNITYPMKETALKAISQLQKIYESEIIPSPTPNRAKCQACEYLPFCGSI